MGLYLGPLCYGYALNLQSCLFGNTRDTSVMHEKAKGLRSRRGEIGPAIEMHTDLKYVYMVYFIEKNRNFICLVLKL